MTRSNDRNRKVVGEVLRELRHEHGLTQEQLSFACDRHRTYVSLLERGKSSPTVETLCKLAKALDTKPSEIMRRVERKLGRR